jgi:hypothetical protein
MKTGSIPVNDWAKDRMADPEPLLAMANEYRSSLFEQLEGNGGSNVHQIHAYGAAIRGEQLPIPGGSQVRPAVQLLGPAEEVHTRRRTAQVNDSMNKVRAKCGNAQSSSLL